MVANLGVKIRHSMNIPQIPKDLWLRLERMDRELSAKSKLDLLEKLIAIGEKRMAVVKAEKSCPYCVAKLEQSVEQTVVAAAVQS